MPFPELESAEKTMQQIKWKGKFFQFAAATVIKDILSEKITHDIALEI